MVTVSLRISVQLFRPVFDAALGDSRILAGETRMQVPKATVYKDRFAQ
jgi:hypothetical protein